MKLHALIKVAGNPKVKRYWQMLKRLYGGTDDTVNELKRTRDFGVYHATGKAQAESILKDKMLATKGEKFFDGNYFGDRSAGNFFTNHVGIGLDRKEKGILLRFKYPKELSKKQNYPKPDNIVKFKDRDLQTYRLRYDDKSDYVIKKISTITENPKEYRKAKYYGKYKDEKGNLTHRRFFRPDEDNQIVIEKDIPGNILKKVTDNKILKPIKHDNIFWTVPQYR